VINTGYVLFSTYNMSTANSNATANIIIIQL